MVKDAKSFDPEMVARQIIADGAPIGKVSKTNLLEVLHVLAGWVRSANLRAKAAEEKLNEMPNWRSQYHDLQAVRRRLESENRQLKADNQALQERYSGYQVELDRWREESDRQLDGLNRQLNEKDDEIKHLTAAFTAALESRKRQGDFAMALAEAAEADIKLAAIVGLDMSKYMNVSET